VAARESPAKASKSEPAPSGRELAVTRSLDSARSRAEGRVQRFLDAGFELLNESASGKDFTVQEVVERSGQSLRSFYQYFGGKQELLLVLFEESVRSTADHLRGYSVEVGDPLERLHRFVTEYYRLCRPVRGGKAKKSPVPVMVEFAQQLLTSHPTEAARAFGPLVSLFAEILAQAAEAGVVRAGLRRELIAGVVLEAIMFNAFSSTISGSSARTDAVDASEELWSFIVHGIGPG
jgi:AcrR family transcriptional regulator